MRKLPPILAIVLVAVYLFSGILSPDSVWAFRKPDPAPSKTSSSVHTLDKQNTPENYLPEDLPVKVISQIPLPAANVEERALFNSIVDYLGNDPDSLRGDISAANLRLIYSHAVPSLDGKSSTQIMEYAQYYGGRLVAGARIRFLIKHFSDPKDANFETGNVVMLAESQLVPENILPRADIPEENLNIAAIGADALGLEPEAAVQGTEKRLIVHLDGEFRNVTKVYYPNGWSAIVVEGTGETYIKDEKYYLAPPILQGMIRARGVRFDPRQTGANLAVLPLSYSEILLQSAGVSLIRNADIRGYFYFPGFTSGQLSGGLRGRWANVTSGQGTPLLFNNFAVNSIRILMNPVGALEFNVSQVNAYYHTTLVHDWLKARLPSFNGLDIQMPVTVDQYSGCNAGFTPMPMSMEFLSSSRWLGMECLNTSFDTVIYHEYGHFADYLAGGMTDPGLSEGWGDLLAAYVSEQPKIGEGMLAAYGMPREMRTADNFYRYPMGGNDDSYALALAWSGFGWDLRRNLMNTHGAGMGKFLAERLITGTLLLNSLDIPGAVKDLLILDDNDANLSNGTPHMQDIMAAADKHDLYPFQNINVARINGIANNQVVKRQQTGNTLLVQGTAANPGGGFNFQNFELAYGAGIKPTQWVLVNSNSSVVTNGVLGTWNIGALLPGTYTLRLLVKTAIPLVQYQYLVRVHIDPPEVPVNIAVNTSENPDIDGNFVVWEQITGFPQRDVFAFNIALRQKRQISVPSFSGEELKPAVSGTRAVWQERLSATATRIYLYDLQASTRQAIGNPLVEKLNPDIYANTVVWEDLRNGNADIYLYDVPTAAENVMAALPGNQVMPKIFGNRVVYADDRNGQWDIYIFDLAANAERRITVDPAKQWNPQVHGNRIVYEDERNGNKEIYLYDISLNQEFRITNTPAESIDPDISDQRIVWTEKQDDRQKIYTFDLSSGATHQVVSSAFEAKESRPAVLGRIGVWAGTAGGGTNPMWGGESTNIWGTFLP